MYHSKLGLGFYVPSNVVTNDDLTKIIDTTDEWIQERTGIEERRHIIRGEDTTTSGVKAAEIAIERSGVAKEDIDFVVFATLSPDYYFPGPGVLVQRDLGLRTVGVDRNQCSGFVYAISVADQYIKTGMYKNILVIGSTFNRPRYDKSRSRRFGYFWRWSRSGCIE
jgi:3-oxoacyl-[acyl-carrier-protein] synthase-3